MAVAYHTRTWLLWLAAAGTAALLTRNPLYLVLIALAARAVDEAAAAYEQAAGPDAADPRRHSWGWFLRVGLLLATVAAGFNGLGSHLGATVLLTLPREWPLIGGPLTVEGFTYGALGGLAVVVVLIVAGTFNLGADTYALLRAIPAALSQAGLVTAIGLAYVPQTITRVREIREAQQLRGHRFRGSGALLPLAVPLLAGGLERAIQLAEAMEARGFSHRTTDPTGGAAAAQRRIRAALLGGTGAVAVGAFLLIYFRQTPTGGAALVLAGLLGLGWALRALGHLSHQSRYRREIWRRRDSGVCVALTLSLVVTVGVWATRAGWWVYSPYLQLAWPPFEPIIGAGLALLAAPALPLLRLTTQTRRGLFDLATQRHGDEC